MKISKGQIFENITSTIESEKVISIKANTLVFQVSGTAKILNISLLVTLDGTNYDETTIINLKSLDVSNNMDSNGIFIADVTGIQNFKLKINSISGGYVSVTYCLENE